MKLFNNFFFLLSRVQHEHMRNHLAQALLFIPDVQVPAPLARAGEQAMLQCILYSINK